MQIIPAIMVKDFWEAEAKIDQIKDVCKWIQIDVTDNALVTGKSFELELLSRIDSIKPLLWDIHLMVKEPINWVNKCVTVAANRISGQIEAMSDADAFVKKIKDEGLEAGIAFDIDTPVEKIPEETDLILLMGRKMGYESYPMEWDKLVYKIKKVKDLGFKVAVDGGVNFDNLIKLEAMEVEVIYATKMVFWGNIKDNLRNLNFNVD